MVESCLLHNSQISTDTKIITVHARHQQFTGCQDYRAVCGSFDMVLKNVPSILSSQWPDITFGELRKNLRCSVVVQKILLYLTVSLGGLFRPLRASVRDLQKSLGLDVHLAR